MKFVGYMFMALAGSSLLMAEIAAMPTESLNNQVISLVNMSEEGLSEFAQGTWPNLILECPQDLSLPLEISVGGQFLALGQLESAPCLKILKTCYVRCEKEGEFLFSSDLQNWTDFFDFFTGEMGAVLRIEEGKPVVRAYFELNQR
jgi:hypothetical protein